MTTRAARWLLAVALIAGACSGSDASTTDAATASEETSIDRPPATATLEVTPAPTTTPLPTPTPVPTPTPPPTPLPTATAVPRPSPPFEIASFEIVLVDSSRETPPSGDAPALDTRTISTWVLHPDVEPGPAGFPLIVFAHGLGGRPESATSILEHWVQEGFVVAAPRFPLSRFDAPAGPDASDVQNQAIDIGFVIDEMLALSDEGEPLHGQLARDAIAIAGHSNGAITVLGTSMHECCRDERVGAVIAMAGTPGRFTPGDYVWSEGPPLLVVHGTDDPLVDYREAGTIFNLAERAKGLLASLGGNHGSWFSPGSPDHGDVAEITTDFLRASVGGDTAAQARLEAWTPAADTATLLTWDPSGTGVVSVPVTPDLDRQVRVDATGPFAEGDSVLVSWSGFAPGGTINVVQCAADGLGGPGACDLVTGHILHPNPSGTGALSLDIVVGPLGTGDCSAGSTECVILVNDSGLSDPDATILIPLDLG